jgi:hypothetical protein
VALLCFTASSVSMLLPPASLYLHSSSSSNNGSLRLHDLAL